MTNILFSCRGYTYRMYMLSCADLFTENENKGVADKYYSERKLFRRTYRCSSTSHYCIFIQFNNQNNSFVEVIAQFLPIQTSNNIYYNVMGCMRRCLHECLSQCKCRQRIIAHQ